MDIEQARDLYRKANELLNYLFRKAYILQNENSYGGQEERNTEVKCIIEKSPFLDELFYTLLNLFEVKKIKNVNMENFTPKDIFEGNINKIIDSICRIQGFKKIDFYKYNVFAFYILSCEVILTLSKQKQINGHSLWFFSNLYDDMSFLLDVYCKTVAKKEFQGEDIACGRRAVYNRNRREIDVLLGIRHLLYGGISGLYSASTDLPNVALFSLRNYIEFWLRENFDAYMEEDKIINISKIFSVLRNNISELKADSVIKNFRGIENHIGTLSAINRWTNYYIHSRWRNLFWIPYLILMYLHFLMDECRHVCQLASGLYELSPPFIPREAPIYTKIYQEIHS